ncbi:TonB-dependent receptor [Sphingorhabdus sp. IMCC26285]|uniref:TonB-dependent receptor n=1 Tax=Sphingorhabdus profundilacus TaxID=2509718 RepID=A0A6I4M7T6_9SPHN|nr:TonB-dependent receptor [Sphingorhabdus profundilacus]MVZ98155.1 TonB-dependent receptor [Sphingorhabdus profundilacus]
MPNYSHIMSAALATIIAGMLPQTIFAQEPMQTSQEDEAQLPADEGSDIVVTGSRIRGAAIASDVITLDQISIVAAGQIDLGEAIRSLPQNFGGGQNPGVGSGGGLINNNINSGSHANLRGLGPDATLTLLNGHRLPYDSAFGGVDISAVPLAALDRIEVVPDGASALYGSDAVAGVVNVILRSDFDGVATSAQIGGSTDGGYFRQQASIVGGKTWNGGGFLIAYDFARNSEIRARQRSYATALNPNATLYPSLNRHAVTFSAHQRLGENVVAKVDALYARRKSQTESRSPTTQFLIEPEAETYTIAPSIEVDLGSGWQAKLLGVFGRDQTYYSTTTTPVTGTARVANGCYCNGITAFEAGAEGPLFALGGGDARLAIGGGFRRNSLGYTQLVNATPSDAFDVTRRSRYAYGELNLPFVSSDLNIRGVDRLSVSAALRYEDYPGLDRLATPRLGLIYAPIPELTLRASWARSFKAPTLYQQYIPYEAILLPGAAFGTGSSTNTVFYTAGGNPDVKPEHATSWTAGFELRPQFLEGLTVSATYYDIRYRDRVVRPIAGSIAAAFRNPGFATLIDFSPTASELSALIAGAQIGLQNFTGRAYNPANVIAFIDNRNINVAAQTIRGLDARLSWNGELGRGRLGLDVDASWLESSQLLTPELPVVQLSGTVFNPPKFRLRAAANYRADGLMLTSALNFTGALKDRRFAIERQLKPGATVDVGASYDIIGGSDRDAGLSVSVTINNLLNDKPEIIRTTGPTDTPYDSTNFSPIGRFIAIGIRRHW